MGAHYHLSAEHCELVLWALHNIGILLENGAIINFSLPVRGTDINIEGDKDSDFDELMLAT
eukprot:141220-Pyramimonas_sp.AAC.1